MSNQPSSDKKVIPIGGSYKDDLARRLNLV